MKIQLSFKEEEEESSKQHCHEITTIIIPIL